jgi:hypothetical protein
MCSAALKNILLRLFGHDGSVAWKFGVATSSEGSDEGAHDEEFDDDD